MCSTFHYRRKDLITNVHDPLAILHVETEGVIASITVVVADLTTLGRKLPIPMLICHRFEWSPSCSTLRSNC